MPSSRNNPAVWLRIQWLRSKVFFFAIALKLLFRLIRLLLGRAPTQEELNLVFEQQQIPVVLATPPRAPGGPTRQAEESPRIPPMP